MVGVVKVLARSEARLRPASDPVDQYSTDLCEIWKQGMYGTKLSQAGFRCEARREKLNLPSLSRRGQLQMGAFVSLSQRHCSTLGEQFNPLNLCLEHPRVSSKLNVRSIGLHRSQWAHAMTLAHLRPLELPWTRLRSQNTIKFPMRSTYVKGERERTLVHYSSPWLLTLVVDATAGPLSGCFVS